METIDVAIIGAGPAGLTAGIYLGRARLKTIIFEKAFAGGQMAVSELIENFPGFTDGISGAELTTKMREQAQNCGARIVEEEITRLSKQKGGFSLKSSENKEYKASSVIIATGAVPKKIGVPGEKEFIGRGVSYCATCDAPLFKEKTAVVVGGGDTAVQEAIFLTKYCKKVYLVHRRDKLRAAKILADRFSANKKIEPLWNSVLVEIKGDKKVTGVVVKNVGANGHSPLQQIACDGVFVFAGIEPSSSVVKGFVDTDEKGFIITDENMKTLCEGLFACGDVRKKTLWQIVTACADGATAAVSAQHYVEKIKGIEY